MDKIYTKKSYAKVNIFLKIVGKRGDYHTLASRFMRVKNLYDTISFIPYKTDKFVLEGDFGCKTEQNTIYKGYIKLLEYLDSIKKDLVENFFLNYKVKVDKTIPEFAGLGGGSSNCATFMVMLNDILALDLDKQTLVDIGVQIGADVPFFIYEYDSANVSGIGEVVEFFDEPILDIKTFTPQVRCNTGEIFKNFRDKFYKQISNDEVEKLFHTTSLEVLQTYTTEELNDLYSPAIDIYPMLQKDRLGLSKDSFFSGSGSSYFMIL